jgi:hypothetical protein
MEDGRRQDLPATARDKGTLEVKERSRLIEDRRQQH